MAGGCGLPAGGELEQDRLDDGEDSLIEGLSFRAHLQQTTVVADKTAHQAVAAGDMSARSHVERAAAA